MLEVLMTARGSKNNGIVRTYAYCYCTEYNLYGWVRLGQLKEGKVTTGRNFNKKSYSECKNIDEYCSQYKWCMCSSGYLVTNINGKNVLKHRFIWETLNGSIPKGFTIDHIDRNKLNNDISNLRLATSLQQNYNMPPKSNTGHHFITFYRKRGYRVNIRNGEYIKYFDSLSEAIKNRNKYLEENGTKHLNII